MREFYIIKIMNLVEYPVQSPVAPDDSETIKEKVMLAKNIVQGYFANLDYHNRYFHEENVPELERDKTIMEYGEEFEQWYTSAEGMSALSNYVEHHNSEEIMQEKDMAVLERSFLAFRNRLSQ